MFSICGYVSCATVFLVKSDVNSVNKNQPGVCPFGPFTVYIEAINDWHDPRLRSAVKRSL